MVNVLYVPLDERACNYKFPQMLSRLTEDMNLLVPPKQWMGCLKEPADREKIWDWIFCEAANCEYAILSVDTLVYGNIIGSRIHHMTEADCDKYLSRFRKLKAEFPALKIHAFNLAARVAAYDDAHEDPDYWNQYGYSIWKLTYLMDKIDSRVASKEEQEEYQTLKEMIPQEIQQDFFDRRAVDQETNLTCVNLVKDGIFDVLTIPKDDTAEYGCAAIDQRAISKKVREEMLFDRVLVYPGADEAGSVLFSRVFCLTHHYTPRIFTRYSSVLGPVIVPLYEDRPLHESVKSQIFSAGGVLEETPERSDCMLALNSPGRHMIESEDQFTKDLTFSSCINMHDFLRFIKYYLETYQKPVGLPEVSVCNGCECEFMDYARISGVLDTVSAVGGWNTSMNTVGVVLAQLIIVSYYNDFREFPEKKKLSVAFKMRSIVTDWLFQSVVQPEFLEIYKNKIDPYFLGEHLNEACSFTSERVNRLLQEKFDHTLSGIRFAPVSIHFDWDGLYYVDVDVSIDEGTSQPV